MCRRMIVRCQAATAAVRVRPEEGTVSVATGCQIHRSSFDSGPVVYFDPTEKKRLSMGPISEGLSV